MLVVTRWCQTRQRVPTRWGNHLNGNIRDKLSQIMKGSPASPHSLGKSFEWKLYDRRFEFMGKLDVVPTYLGNQSLYQPEHSKNIRRIRRL
jgi:hypothetical protein